MLAVSMLILIMILTVVGYFVLNIENEGNEGCSGNFAGDDCYQI